MNILVCTFSFPDPSIGSYDGRFVLSEALGYSQNGASVLVLTPHYPGARRDEMLDDHIRVLRIPYFLPERLQRLKAPGLPLYRNKSTLALVQIPLLLGAMGLALLRHARWADIIHAQWTLSGLLALPVKWLCGTPVVVTARGSDLRLLPRWLNRFLHRQIDAAIDCFGPQPWNVEYKRVYTARYLTLPLCVDAGDPKDLAPELVLARNDPTRPLIVLYIGRFDRIKLEESRLPLLVLIEAAALLAERGTPVRVFFVGHGEPAIEHRMIEAIARFGVQASVTLLGPRNHVAPYVRACDLGVGGIAFNGVAQDFTVNAKPQILMASADNADTPWKDGLNALFVRPDDPVAMAERLEWAVAHRDEIAAIGQTARGMLRDLVSDTREAGRHYIQAFEQIIAQSPGKP